MTMADFRGAFGLGWRSRVRSGWEWDTSSFDFDWRVMTLLPGKGGFRRLEI